MSPIEIATRGTMSSSTPIRAADQPLRYRDDSFDEGRNDRFLDSDNAPLINTKDNQPAWSMNEPPKKLKTIRVLTALTLTSSVLAAMTLIALKIFNEQETWGGYELLWPSRAGSRAVGITAVFSIVISLYNLIRLQKDKSTAPLLINLLFDFLVGFLVLAYAVPGLFSLPGTRCVGWLRNSRDYARCHKHALPSRIIVGVALALGFIYGIAHLVLFAIRLHQALTSKAGSGITIPAWKFPTGKLKFETSVTFERKPEQSPREEEVGA